MSDIIVDDSIEKISQEEALNKIDELKDLIHSDEFREAVKKCTDKHVEIITTYKPEIAECKEDFADAGVACMPDLSKKDKKHRCREFASTFNKLQGYWDNEEAANGETKISRLAAQVGQLVKWFDFLGDDRIVEALKLNGIYLDEKKMGKVTDEYPLTASCANTMKSCLDDAKVKNSKIREATKELTEDLYANNVPSDLQFDKDINPIGLKASSFNKICKANAVKMSKSKEKADKYISGLAEKSAFNEASEQLMQESLSEIFN